MGGSGSLTYAEGNLPLGVRIASCDDFTAYVNSAEKTRSELLPVAGCLALTLSLTSLLPGYQVNHSVPHWVNLCSGSIIVLQTFTLFAVSLARVTVGHFDTSQ